MKLMKSRPAKLSQREERFTSVFQLLGDKTRFRIFKLLLSNKEFCVSEIAEMVGISVPAASQHFRLFELMGVVEKKRYSQMICYVLKENDALVQDLITLIQTKR